MSHFHPRYSSFRYTCHLMLGFKDVMLYEKVEVTCNGNEYKKTELYSKQDIFICQDFNLWKIWQRIILFFLYSKYQLPDEYLVFMFICESFLWKLYQAYTFPLANDTRISEIMNIYENLYKYSSNKYESCVI